LAAKWSKNGPPGRNKNIFSLVSQRN